MNSISCSSGAVAQKSREFVHGFEIYLERATLTYESGAMPLTVLTAQGSSVPPLAGGGDPITAFANEIQTAVDGVAAGKEPDLLSGKLARDALVLCHKEIESVRTGQAVAVDIPDPIDPEPRPEALPLPIVYQDRDLIVVDKPAGMVVHPAAGHASAPRYAAAAADCVAGRMPNAWQIAYVSSARLRV